MGWTRRSATPDDLEAICALVNRAEAHDGVPRVLTLEDLRQELDGVRVRFDTDVQVVERAGVLVGYAHTFHLPSNVGEERCYIFGTVDPGARGDGIGRDLLAWGIERASAQLRSGGRSLPRYIRVDAYDHLESAHRLYGRLGFTPARWFEELLRPLDDVPEVAAVDGARIVPWPADRDDDIRATKNLAFVDHWGATSTSPGHWHDMVRGHGARADLSFIALDDADQVVAYVLNHRYEADDALLGRRDGWIGSLGTVRAWRGRGVGSALVVRSLHAFRDVGLTHASIGVDGESPTGAARLYRALGFEPRHRSITHQILVE